MRLLLTHTVEQSSSESKGLPQGPEGRDFILKYSYFAIVRILPLKLFAENSLFLNLLLPQSLPFNPLIKKKKMEKS